MYLRVNRRKGVASCSLVRALEKVALTFRFHAKEVTTALVSVLGSATFGCLSKAISTSRSRPAQQPAAALRRAVVSWSSRRPTCLDPFVLAVTRGMVEGSRLIPPPLPLARCSRAAKPWLLDEQIFCQGLAP